MKLKLCLLSSTILSLPVLAFAQQADSQAGSVPAPATDQVAQAPAAPTSGIQEIVVTSQRRSQKLIDVPNTVQAFTGNQLNNVGIKDIYDLQTQVPGYQPSKNSGYTQIFIRGIGNSVYVGADPSVATYIDDVPRIYGSSVSQLVDVDRIEVLKGAQGGLYGRNATGGVVNIITKQPSLDSIYGQVLLDYGEHNQIRNAAYVNIPVTDQVAILAAVEHDQHRPYFENLAVENPYTAAMFPFGSAFGNSQQTANFLNSHVKPPQGSNQQFNAGEVKVLLKPADNIKITWSADYNNKKDTDGGTLQQDTPANEQILLNSFLTPFTGGTQVLPANFLYGPNGKFTFAEGTPTPVNNTDYGTSLTAVMSLQGFDLTSITAYRYQHTTFGTNLGSSPVPNLTVTVNNHKHFVYQEVRAVSTDPGPWHWLGGVTYLSNHFTGDTHTYLLSSPYDGGIACPAFLPDCAAGRPTHPIQDIEDATVYGQVGYDITDHLNATLSWRYLYEHNQTTFVDTVVAANNASLKTKEEASIPSFTLSYKLDPDSFVDWFDDGNLYARFARGFKAGGINPVANPNSFIAAGAPLSAGEVFGPERVDTYETGIRVAALENKVHFTSSVFFNDYSNLQNSSAHAQPKYAAAVILAIVNVPKARTYGWEETLQVKVAPPLTLGLNAGYLNAEYLSGIPESPILSELPIGHTTMTNSPKWMGSFTADYKQPLTDDFTLVGNLVESYVSKTKFNFSGFDILGNPQAAPTGSAYWLTNIRIGIQAYDDEFELAFFGTNLFNRQYYTAGNSGPTNGIEYTPADPRVLGGEFIWHFSIPNESPAEAAPAPVAPPPPPPPPAATAPEAQRQFQVFFDFDKSDITSAASQVIQAAADTVKSGHIATVSVTGHTDTVGTIRYNQALSERRASAVKAALISDGVPAEEISAMGVGKSDLLVPTGDGVREPQNRRAVILMGQANS